MLAGRRLAHWRPSWRWLLGVLRSFAVSFAALALTLKLVPGDQVPEHGFQSVATLVVTVLLVGALIRPLLTELTVLTGVLGLLLSGFLTQSIVLGVALAVVPAVQGLDGPEIVFAAWGVAIIAALLNWVIDTSTEEVFLGQVLGQAVRTAAQHDVSGPGLLIVQLDGVAEPLVRQAAAAGAMPFLTRSLRDGGHQLRRWHTGIPSTTPAGQAVLLHGDVTSVPGFRWYDKELGRTVVVNRGSDAQEVEAGFTTGRGLLADGGVSVANLFSGDAPVAALTLSNPRLPGNEHGAAAFASARSGFARSAVLFVGQVLTEWHQARRQRKRDVVPRVPRGGAFVFLRGLTTVLLRDLTVSIVADQMARGAPVVYVDLLDYDEVAHHAGPTRPESLRTLEGMDRVLQFLTQVAAEVGRDYELVVVSDHGQTQGSTFLQLEGRSLADAVRRIVDVEVTVTAETVAAEVLSPATVLGIDDRSQRVLRRMAARDAEHERGHRHGPRHGRRLARDDRQEVHRYEAGVEQPDAVEVAASGSIAHLYLARHVGRLTRDEVEAALPGLLPGLRSLANVGLVMTRRGDGSLLVEDGPDRREITVGPDGAPEIRGGAGRDPLAPYGPHAAADLLQLETRHHVGDVVLLGRYDERLGEVAAFEELVGSHGGLGGWQTEALLAHPASWSVPDGVLSGEQVHRVLVDRLAALGLRAFEGSGESEGSEESEESAAGGRSHRSDPSSPPLPAVPRATRPEEPAR